MTLSTEQQQAVESTCARTGIVAGPGSGKTRVLVERINLMIERWGCPANRIAVITFTNAGANELRERLPNAAQLGYLGTLHGYCFRLLQRYGEGVGYRPGGINLVTEELAEQLLTEAADRLNYKGSRKALKEARDTPARRVLAEYRFQLKTNNLVDYDGVLVDALKLLQSGAVDRRLLPAVLLVDEAQDGATVDWEIYEAIAAASFTFVGDTDQGIFSFRGADPGAFLLALSEPNTSTFKMETNYRCAAAICGAANRLIDCNEQRLPKHTIAAGYELGRCEYRAFETCAQERFSVAATIQQDYANTPREAIAVLCRTNYIAKQMRAALEGLGVPVRRPRVDQRPPQWGKVIDILSMWRDRRSDILTARVLTALGEPVEAARRLALAEGIWLNSAAERLHLVPDSFTDRAAEVADRLARYGIDRETLDYVRSIAARLPQPDPTVADLLHALHTSRQDNPTEQADGGVTVSTIHAAKGREWDIVFLPGWEDGVLPALKRDSNLEEERRLAFVALTRARRGVHVSSALRRVGEFKTVEGQPSQFITEAGL